MSHPVRTVHPMTIHQIATDAPEHTAAPQVTLDDERFVVDGLEVTDATARTLVAAAPIDERLDVVRRMVEVGAHGMTSMGLGMDLAAIDERVGSVVHAAATQAETALGSILDESQRRIAEQFDPQRRSSILARALSDFSEWRDRFLERIDPTLEGSAATELLARMHALVGPDGTFERRLSNALDLEQPESALARLRQTVEEGFIDLRRELAVEQAQAEARHDEAQRGTAHGLEFEDAVEVHLREWAARRSGCFVERTGTTPGSLGAGSKVGDFVVTLEDGRRIVIEAKRHATISVGGANGILQELDSAMANRNAETAICVAGRDAFPTEVGRFDVFGNRILVVDEGEGTMIEIALQWAASALAGQAGAGFDAGVVADRIDRIRKAAEQLSGARKNVTSIRASLEKLHEQLGAIRTDILDQVTDLDRSVSGGSEAPSPESLGSAGVRS